MKYLAVQQNDENRWRAVILFGKNSACFKFALARSLLWAAGQGKEAIPLTELALPYARAVADHISRVDRQGTARKSQFLAACRAFNRGKLTEEQLREATVRHGFENVIDAFHNIGGDLGDRFFEDERKSSLKGLRLTDAAFRLLESPAAADLPHEVEARWRLVETAWHLRLPRGALTVGYEADRGLLVTQDGGPDRIDLTPCRNALNGYQKGKCFYCFTGVSVVDGSPDLADVDHFLPHVLTEHLRLGLDGVWNLVLACQNCNRGVGGKSDRVPTQVLLERLHRRNEFYIDSHHPLRETLIAQTGETSQERVRFLARAYQTAATHRIATWEPADALAPAF
jgi:hypothetical protein